MRHRAEVGSSKQDPSEPFKTLTETEMPLRVAEVCCKRLKSLELTIGPMEHTKTEEMSSTGLLNSFIAQHWNSNNLSIAP